MGICNEIINAIPDETQYEDIESLRNWRKNTLKSDKIHDELIEQQIVFQKKAKKKCLEQGNDAVIEYPYNAFCEQNECNLLSPKCKQTNVPKHRYSIVKQAEVALAWNNQTISPASLQPHRFYTIYPLKNECFADVDIEYAQKEKISNCDNLNSTISPTSPLEICQNPDHKISNSSKERDDYSEHYEEKSNAIKREEEIKKNENERRRDRKRKRSESSDREYKKIKIIDIKKEKLSGVNIENIILRMIEFLIITSTKNQKKNIKKHHCENMIELNEIV